MTKSKLATPAWITEGFDSPAEYAKAKGKTVNKKFEAPNKFGHHSTKSNGGKIFKIKKCPKCGSDNVNILLTGEEGKAVREWECKKCKWQGKNIEEEELTEEEFMKYLDEKGVEVS